MIRGDRLHVGLCVTLAEVPRFSEAGDVFVAGFYRTSHFSLPFFALVVLAEARRPSRCNARKSQTA